MRQLIGANNARKPVGRSLEPNGRRRVASVGTAPRPVKTPELPVVAERKRATAGAGSKAVKRRQPQKPRSDGKAKT